MPRHLMALLFVGHALTVIAFVVAGRAGWIPGVGDVPAESVTWTVYRVVALGVVVSLAVGLGAWTGIFGTVWGWRWGLAALMAGGLVTGLLLSAAPMILFARDQYPVTFSWLIAGAPLAGAVWLSVLLLDRLSGTGPVSVV